MKYKDKVAIKSNDSMRIERAENGFVVEVTQSGPNYKTDRHVFDKLSKVLIYITKRFGGMIEDDEDEYGR